MSNTNTKLLQCSPQGAWQYLLDMIYKYRNLINAIQLTKNSICKKRFGATLRIRTRPVFSQLQSATWALMWPVSTGWYCCRPHQSNRRPQHSSEHIAYSSFYSNTISAPALAKQTAQASSVCSLADCHKEPETFNQSLREKIMQRK